jgi:hypothetical protein
MVRMSEMRRREMDQGGRRECTDAVCDFLDGGCANDGHGDACACVSRWVYCKSTLTLLPQRPRECNLCHRHPVLLCHLLNAADNILCASETLVSSDKAQRRREGGAHASPMPWAVSFSAVIGCVSIPRARGNQWMIPTPKCCDGEVRVVE